MTSGPRVLLDGDALRHNLAALKATAGEHCAVAAVLKANAYGHGLEPVAGLLAGDVEFFAVSEVADAMTLAGRGPDVLLMGPADPGDHADLLAAGVIVTIDSLERLRALAARRPSGPARLHLLVDTGLRRLGVDCADVPAVLRCADDLGLPFEGAFLHPAAADAGDWQRVEAEVAALDAGLGGRRLRRHHGGTSLAIERPDLAGDVVRAGIGLFGHHPSPRQRQLVDLRPTLRLEAPVLAVKHVRAGEHVGYAGRPPTARDTVLATLGIGVSHGLAPGLAAGGVVTIGGDACPFVGSPSLEYCQVDVTALPHVARGGVAVVIGGPPAAPTSVQQVAARAGVVADDVFASISDRLTRTVVS